MKDKRKEKIELFFKTHPHCGVFDKNYRDVWQEVVGHDDLGTVITDIQLRHRVICNSGHVVSVLQIFDEDDTPDLYIRFLKSACDSGKVVTPKEECENCRNLHSIYEELSLFLENLEKLNE